MFSKIKMKVCSLYFEMPIIKNEGFLTPGTLFQIESFLDRCDKNL